MLKKEMLTHWIASDGVGGSRFKHRWLLKFLLNRHTNLLNSLVNKQARSYAALDKFDQLIKEHPESTEKLTKMMSVIREEMAQRENNIELEQEEVVAP